MKAKRRFLDHKPPFVGIKRMAADHPSVVTGTTLYPARVAAPERGMLFKSGQHSRKIGGNVTKGRWSGMPIYTLTLEERATCPRDCSHWSTCFGGKMNWSVRWRHGAQLEEYIKFDILALARRHPRGFVVRLHVLGDFYSVEYVDLWARMLDAHPALRVFGYTARDPVGDPIGVRLDTLSRTRWDRFAMRFSNRWLPERSALTLWKPGGVPAHAGVICPAQTGKTECCGTCGLCWQTTKTIFFQVH